MEKAGGGWDLLFTVFYFLRIYIFAMNIQYFYNLKNCFNKK